MEAGVIEPLPLHSLPWNCCHAGRGSASISGGPVRSGGGFPAGGEAPVRREAEGALCRHALRAAERATLPVINHMSVCQPLTKDD
jgi:hypothetical protein